MEIGVGASIQQGGDSSTTVWLSLPQSLARIDLHPHHPATEGDKRRHQQRRRPPPMVGEPGCEAGRDHPAHVRAHVHHTRQGARMCLGEIGRHAPVGPDGEIEAADQVGKRNGTWSLFWN